MTGKSKNQRDERRRRVDVWIAGLGIVVAAAAGLGGAVGGATIASSAADRQIKNDQIAVLRQERVAVFATYLSRLDQSINGGPSSVGKTGQEWLNRVQEEAREYESALQEARLYASADQLDLVNELDDLIVDIVDSTDEEERQARDKFDEVSQQLFELLRDDLQFASDQ